ncbi:polysaccharide export outer membrane protein [Duganella sp. HSC-15S17]|uniref:Polysaccharide export outer membrane protein n=2 Tax=Duganella violaceipulchra TaxID=2849652 RepID=A0ABT1GMV2_9BURK|nr:polysaccharide export outer membrane protein [Duganella violaceicalia]
MMKRYVLRMALFLLALTGQAMAAELTLGPSDVVKVTVYNNPDLAVETRVSESGFITFPLLGQVAVSGLTVSAAEKKLGTLLETGGFVKKPQVNMLLTLAQSQQVSVLGQINRPGRYPMDARRGLMDVLAMAGGIAADGGDLVTVVSTRGDKLSKETVDIIQMVRSANFDHNVELAPGDVVYVERAPRFYIYGEVQRPGPFRLERNMTVVQALSAGGGLTARGTERGIRIKRRDQAGVLQTIDAKHDDLVQADDVVYVKESLF